MRNTAFTLLETVIVIAITALMLMALTNLYLNFNALYVNQETVVATARSVGSTMNALGAATLPATHVLASHAFSIGTLSSGAGTLVLEVPSVNASGVVIANTYDRVAFYLTGTDLYQITETSPSSARPSGTKKVAALIHTLSFAYNNIDFAQVTSVGVDVTAQLVTRQGPIERTLHETFYLRNI